MFTTGPILNRYTLFRNSLFSLFKDSQSFLFQRSLCRTLSHLGHLIFKFFQLLVETVDFLLDRLGAIVHLRTGIDKWFLFRPRSKHSVNYVAVGSRSVRTPFMTASMSGGGAFSLDLPKMRFISSGVPRTRVAERTRRRSNNGRQLRSSRFDTTSERVLRISLLIWENSYRFRYQLPSGKSPIKTAAQSLVAEVR